MLYTVVPLELVFADVLPDTEEEVRGSARLIWRKGAGERTLMRVISSDLRDYLRYRL